MPKATHSRGDIVVVAKNVARAATVSVFDVGQDAVQGKEAEGAAVHFVNAAEAAQMQAAARGLDSIGAAEIHVKSLDKTLIAGRYPDSGQVFERARRIVAETSFLFVRKPEDVFHPLPAGLDAIQQLSKREVSFSPHQAVPPARIGTGGDAFRKQRGMIASEHGANPAIKLLGQIGQADRGVVLKSHRGEAYDVRPELPQELQEARDSLLAPNYSVNHPDIMVIDLAGNRGHGDTWRLPLLAWNPWGCCGALNQQCSHLTST